MALLRHEGSSDIDCCIRIWIVFLIDVFSMFHGNPQHTFLGVNCFTHISMN